MRNDSLTGRILFSVTALVALTGALVAGLLFVSWTVGGVVAPFLFAPRVWGHYLGGMVGGAACVRLLVATFRRGGVSTAAVLDAVPPSETTGSNRDLADLVQRVALQFDVPAPTVSVAETPVPHASVSGFTRRNTTLVVSTGLLDRLSDEELRAVVAHEMAHVSNRDAAVVSLVALPTVFGRSILNGLGMDDEETPVTSNADDLLGIGALVFGGAIWLVGRSLLALFARQRELAADRAAVELAGSAAALAAALQKVDAEAVDAPTTDLRKADTVAAFSIVEPPRASNDGFSIWADGRTPPVLRVRNRLDDIGNWLFRTHPSTEKRCELLRSQL